MKVLVFWAVMSSPTPPQLLQALCGLFAQPRKCPQMPKHVLLVAKPVPTKRTCRDAPIIRLLGTRLKLKPRLASGHRDNPIMSGLLLTRSRFCHFDYRAL